MPMPCYISIEGATQGFITQGAFTSDSVGNIFVEGHEDEMIAYEVEHLVEVPIQPLNGVTAGPRIHRAIKITTILSNAIPLLYNALVTSEVLTEVRLTWYRTSFEGKIECFFTTKLTDAVVTAIDCKMPHCEPTSHRSFTQLIDISFNYRMINWNHDLCQTTGGDDWRIPVTE
jgi:type VI secretion system secreted protein Hcp